MEQPSGSHPGEEVPGYRDGVRRIWARIEKMEAPITRRAEEPVQPQTEGDAKDGAQKANGKSVKGKPAKKDRPAKDTLDATPEAPSDGTSKTSKPAQTASKAKSNKKALTVNVSAPREGTKMAQVIAMLQRKNGATLIEIMEKMTWQQFTGQ